MHAAAYCCLEVKSVIKLMHLNIFWYFWQVSEGSTVEGNLKFNFSHKRWPNKKALQRYVRREYPLLASYTEVKGANQLELKVGSVLSFSENRSLGTECNIDSLTESRVLTAYSTVQLKTEGCFHEDYIGDNQV